MKLTNPTTQELSEAVAEHVAGWHFLRAEKDTGGFKMEISSWFDESGRLVEAPSFAFSADAVLPLLAKWQWYVDTSWCTGGLGSPFPPVPTHLWVKIFVCESWLPPFRFPKEPTRGYCEPFVWAGNGPFARTACIALLRAHGHEVVDLYT